MFPKYRDERHVSDSADSADDVHEPLIGQVHQLGFADSLSANARRLKRKTLYRALVAVVVLCATGLIAFTVHSKTLLLSSASPAHCSKLMVRHFQSYTGLGSEYGVYLRAAALSSAMGWTVVPDSKDWIYGDLNNFFLPINYDCAVPEDVLNSDSYVDFGTDGWDTHTRLRLTRDFQQLLRLETLIQVKQLDKTKTQKFVQKAKLWAMDHDHLTLPYGESVPEGEETAFLAQAAVLDSQWIPTPKMQAQISRLATRLGLEESDITKRRPVIALQIRLGDKVSELSDMLMCGSHMKYDDMNVYLRAAQLAHARLYSAATTPQPWPTRTKDSPKPLLVVMTAETGVVEQLEALDTEHEFDIILTPSYELTAAQQEEYQRIFNVSTAPTLARRWEQKQLEEASLDLRLAMTRQLISELIVYSRYADAFIVSGNSNLGRMALLLGGASGGLGYPNHRAVGGRIRSIDVPFYPTTWLVSTFDYR